jgi:hypothetical protein
MPLNLGVQISRVTGHHAVLHWQHLHSPGSSQEQSEVTEGIELIRSSNLCDSETKREWRSLNLSDVVQMPAFCWDTNVDVLGRTRATLTEPTSSSPWPEGLGNLVKLCRAGDRALQLLLFNEEFLVSTSHQLVLITSLPFVHTARRYYRLNGSVRPSDWLQEVGNDLPEPESSSNLVI